MIDGATDNITATVSGVSVSISTSVAVNPATNKIYVVNDRGNVTVIDPATNTVAVTASVGSFPHAVAFNPVTKKTHVITGGGLDVWLIDGVDNMCRLLISQKLTQWISLFHALSF